MTTPTPQTAYVTASGTITTDPFLTIIAARDPNNGDINHFVGKRWVNSLTIHEWILIGFNSSNGIVTPNWQPLSSSSTVESFVTNVAGPVDPNGSNQILVNASTTTYTDGTTANTLKTELQGTLNDIFVGAGALTPATQIATANNGVLITSTTGVPSILPNGTTGQVLTATTGSPPSWSSSAGDVLSITATAPLTANAASGTPETGAVTVALTTPLVGTYGGTGVNNGAKTINLGSPTSGYVLTSDGSGNGTWQANPGSTGFASVNIQVISSTGTYTPTSNMVYCIAECIGGGGAGGGAPTTSGSQYSAGGGGGAGEYARGVFSASSIGASQSVTIGAAGAGASATTGGNGGTTSLGILLTAAGGSGGPVTAATGGGGGASCLGGAGGTGGSGGTLRSPGSAGGTGLVSISGLVLFSGAGASSQYGSGGLAPASNGIATAAGNAATGYGSGGSGALANISSANQTGGAGTKGVVVITEFIS